MQIVLLLLGPVVLWYVGLKDHEKVWKQFSAKTLCYVCHGLPFVLLISFLSSLYLPVNTMGALHVFVLLLREILLPLLAVYLASAWGMQAISPYTRSSKNKTAIKQFLYLLYLFLCIYNGGRFLFIQNIERIAYVGAVAPFFSLMIPLIGITILDLLSVTSKRMRPENHRSRKKQDFLSFVQSRRAHQLVLLLSYVVFVVFTAMLFYQNRYLLFGIFAVIFAGCMGALVKLGTLAPLTRLFVHSHAP